MHIHEIRMDDSMSFHLRCDVQGMVETARAAQTAVITGGDEAPDQEQIEEQGMTPVQVEAARVAARHRFHGATATPWLSYMQAWVTASASYLADNAMMTHVRAIPDILNSGTVGGNADRAGLRCPRRRPSTRAWRCCGTCCRRTFPRWGTSSSAS